MRYHEEARDKGTLSDPRKDAPYVIKMADITTNWELKDLDSYKFKLLHRYQKC